MPPGRQPAYAAASNQDLSFVTNIDVHKNLLNALRMG